MKVVEITHAHFFCGIGSGAKGFNDGNARIGNLKARFRCLGGIDNNPAAIADFEKIVGVPGTLMDLFDRSQYTRWYGHEPPTDWKVVTPNDIRLAFGNERPNILFTSPPCKGLSGLLPETKSKSEKYQALNELTLRGVWLAMEAWQDDPPEFFLLENVPRIMNRGRHLLDQICELLRRYGYATAETTHDCGELGGLAQTRRRFLLVARHQEKVPPFLYEPPKRPLRGVGEILDKLPLPSDPMAGPMHRLPSLHWKTWVRLAFVEAGADWRSLNRLVVQDGVLRDYLLVPEMRRGTLGVRAWGQPGCTVTGTCRSYNGAHNVADPRFNGGCYGQYGVRKFDQPAGTVTSQRSPGQGSFSVADPRYDSKSDGCARFNNVYRVIHYDQTANTITAGTGPTSGGQAVADPRANAFAHGWGVLRYSDTSGTVAGQTFPSNGRFSVADPRVNWSPNAHRNKLRLVGYNDPSGVVAGSRGPYSGALSVADPRPVGLRRDKGDNYLTGGHYGIVPWCAPSNAVSGSACHDNGYNSVADPRLPEADEKCTPLIVSEDNTWHRPFTTLELAALQSLIDAETWTLQLSGNSDSAWRERIGNAVPRAAAKAIASVMGKTILLARTGETFVLDSMPIWVQPLVVAVTVDTP